MTAEATPWRDWLAGAMRGGFTPAEFWRLSLVEWRALISPARQALRAGELADLMTRFPDTRS